MGFLNPNIFLRQLVFSWGRRQEAGGLPDPRYSKLLGLASYFHGPQEGRRASGQVATNPTGPRRKEAGALQWESPRQASWPTSVIWVASFFFFSEPVLSLPVRIIQGLRACSLALGCVLAADRRRDAASWRGRWEKGRVLPSDAQYGPWPLLDFFGHLSSTQPDGGGSACLRAGVTLGYGEDGGCPVGAGSQAGGDLRRLHGRQVKFHLVPYIRPHRVGPRSRVGGCGGD